VMDRLRSSHGQEAWAQVIMERGHLRVSVVRVCWLLRGRHLGLMQAVGRVVLLMMLLWGGKKSNTRKIRSRVQAARTAKAGVTRLSEIQSLR
jgi:hypothetical protein